MLRRLAILTRWPSLWFAFLVLPSLAWTQPFAALSLEDYFRIESGSDPALSPDGRTVVFTRGRIDREADRRRSELWMAPTDGSSPPRRLTSSAFDASDARYSPDGKLILFRSHRAEGVGPIWFLRTEEAGEAFQIASIETMPRFSPKDGAMAFTRKTPPPSEPEPPGTELERELEARFEGKAYDWMQFRFDRRGYLPDPRDPSASPPEELYIIIGGGEPRRLTNLGVDVSGFDWSPDGERLVFTADAFQRDEYVYERADLWLVDRNGKTERLTDDGFQHSAPAFSPDGKRIAFRRVKGLSKVIAEAQPRGAPVDLWVMELPGRKIENLTADWNLVPGSPIWSQDGKSVYFDAQIGGSAHLFSASVDRAASVRQVTVGDRRLGGFQLSADQSKLAFHGTDVTHPEEVFVADFADGEASGERQISHFNRAWLGERRLRSARRLLYPSTDGTEVEGWVILPETEASGEPLIASIHGGPHGAYGNQFNFQFQLWAATGYAVFYSNPRGSTGYGHEFLYATWGGGWGNLDGEDVMAGVDQVLAIHALDGSRLGVTGYSYGGFLTDWILGQTDRFAAAVSGAGISNWISDYGTADIPRTKESEFYGPPWGELGGELLWRQSPIRNVGRVATPTLFIHGESDLRVPIEQGEQMYTALKKRRVPAKFIRYPDAYHGGWKPWDMVHRYHHELKWWSRYLAEKSPTSQ